MVSVVVGNLWLLWKSLQDWLRLSATTRLLPLRFVRLWLVVDNLLRLWMDVDLHLGYIKHRRHPCIYLFRPTYILGPLSHSKNLATAKDDSAEIGSHLFYLGQLTWLNFLLKLHRFSWQRNSALQWPWKYICSPTPATTRSLCATNEETLLAYFCFHFCFLVTIRRLCIIWRLSWYVCFQLSFLVLQFFLDRAESTVLRSGSPCQNFPALLASDVC